MVCIQMARNRIVAVTGVVVVDVDGVAAGGVSVLGYATFVVGQQSNCISAYSSGGKSQGERSSVSQLD